MQTCSDRCAKIRDLGFTTSVHIKMYGEHFEIVSEPFDEGDCIAVRAISRNDLVVRALRLPIAILARLADRFLKRAAPDQGITSYSGRAARRILPRGSDDAMSTDHTHLTSII
jgi:hypothetical protein